MKESEQDLPTAARQPGNPGAEPDSSSFDDPVALVGYGRRGDPRGRRRLYDTPQSGTYVEIKVADIVDPPSKTRDLEPGQIAIWVKAGSKVSFVEYPVRHLFARPPWPR